MFFDLTDIDQSSGDVADLLNDNILAGTAVQMLYDAINAAADEWQ